MADKSGDKKGSWTENDKLAFFLDLFDSGASSIDWSKAALPPGKTKNAVQKMMKRCKDQCKAELEVLKAQREAVSETGKDKESIPAKAAPKKANKGKDSVKVEGAEDDLGVLLKDTQADDNEGEEEETSPKKAGSKGGRKRVREQ